MAIQISEWIALTSLATSFLAYFEAKKANQTSESVQALKEVINASEKTQTYLQRLADGRDRDRNIEYVLAESWSSAAFLISRVNKELSVRLDAKSKFWRNRDTWTHELRAYKDIGLDSVTNEAKRIMSSYV